MAFYEVLTLIKMDMVAVAWGGLGGNAESILH